MMKLAFIICVSIVVGCTDNGRWEIVKSNIDDAQFPNDEIYFQSPDTGIFCGSVLYEGDKTNGKLSVFRPRIVMTTTGGKKWIEIRPPSNVTGTVFQAACKDSTIVCLIGSTIYKTNNLGRNWHAVFPIPVKPYHLHLPEAGLAYFISDADNSKYLFKYENDKVDTIHRLPGNREYRFSNGSLYSFAANDDRVAREMTEENLIDGREENYVLPQSEEISFIAKLKQGRSIIVANDRLIAVDSGRVSITHPTFLKNYMVKEVLSKEGLIICICFNRDERKEVLTDVYFISKDYGRTWHLFQKESGSNKKKFLFKNSMLISYEYPYGMQILRP